MSVEAQELIKEYTKKAQEAKNTYEQQMYFNKIELLEKGCCPLCRSELPPSHELKM